MTFNQRIKALHTVACFMVGAPVCPIFYVQKLTVLSNNNTVDLLHKITYNAKYPT